MTASALTEDVKARRNMEATKDLEIISNNNIEWIKVIWMAAEVSRR
jgi:hypothetical protein